MRYFQAKISENRGLGGGYYVLRLSGCASLASAKPGQFVMIRGAWGRDPLLPRAFSLLAVGAGGTADILAKTVGRGTALLERALPGAEVDVLGPLGSSFPEPQADTTDLLVAGGVGLPPLYMQGSAGGRAAAGGSLRDDLRRSRRRRSGPAPRDADDGPQPVPHHRERRRRDQGPRDQGASRRGSSTTAARPSA